MKSKRIAALILALGVLLSVSIADAPRVYAKTAAEYGNNAVLNVAGLKKVMPIASGRADVTSETGLTGWTAVLDSADLYVPSAAKFANAQAEEAINVVRISLPAGASDKDKLIVSLWSPAIAEDACLHAYRYADGTWSEIASSVRAEHIDIDLSGTTGGIVAITRHSAFRYEHNPAANPKVMQDAIVNPDAIYGFSPDPASKRLGKYADAIDWSDPVAVAAAKKDREDYLAADRDLYHMIEKLLGEGKDVETIARAVSKRRNEIRLESYKDDPAGLAIVKQSNLDTYGNEEGPTADYLYAKYGSWQTVMEKALSSNAGMDACLGLYDENYEVHAAFMD